LSGSLAAAGTGLTLSTFIRIYLYIPQSAAICYPVKPALLVSWLPDTHRASSAQDLI
jgi:hypothetical protein